MLVMECGATKSQLRLFDGRGQGLDAAGCGVNFATMPVQTAIDKCIDLIDSALAKSDSKEAYEIHLYAAGVTDTALNSRIASAFQDRYNCQNVEIQSDLMAAARAVCGRKAGIAAILGTGSNSCQYDGEKIVNHINTGGFILGDEGSAAALGRIFISDYIKNLVPQEIGLPFGEQFKLCYASIVEAVYRSEAPSAFLGSFAPFVLSHYQHPYVKGIVDANFKSFIDRALKQYDRLPVGIVGGFGYQCRDIIAPLLEQAGFTLVNCCRYPIDMLVRFHLSHS